MGRFFQGAARVLQSRHGKIMRLPLPRARADELAWRTHLTLASMRAGKGSMTAAQTLLEAIVMTGFLTEAGYGPLARAQMTEAEQAVCDAMARGNDGDHWSLEPVAAKKLEAIVTLHDQQLREAPLSVVAQASDRLSQFKLGQPCGRVRKGQR